MPVPGPAVRPGDQQHHGHAISLSINLILTTPTDLWALRYPQTHDLYVLSRAAGGEHGDRHLDHASAPGTVRVRSADLALAPSVVVATERTDEEHHRATDELSP